MKYHSRHDIHQSSSAICARRSSKGSKGDENGNGKVLYEFHDEISVDTQLSSSL